MRAQADSERHLLEQLAAGEREKLSAQALGQRLMVESVNGDVSSFVKLAMVQGGTFEKVAEQNANAIKGGFWGSLCCLALAEATLVAGWFLGGT